ncbi:MAG TPA: hypothetical protein VNW92_17865, partial [Polyangiaceae bacterium]|nr:hypothetical protein [Polyangiaceae bacterium]
PHRSTVRLQHMAQATHENMRGELIEYESSWEQDVFVARILQLTKDPSKTASDLVDLVFGSENPILDKTLFPGRSAATKAIHDTPIYRVFADVLHRKEAQDARARRELSATR